MKDQQVKQWTPSLMGEKGGKSKSLKKILAVRKNGKLGGRPKKKLRIK